MKKSTLLLVLVLMLAMLMQGMPIQAYGSMGEPIADYDKYGYYTYYDFENYGTASDHRAYMGTATVTNADGLLCDPYGFRLTNGKLDGTGEVITEDNGNTYYRYTTKGTKSENTIAVFGMEAKDGKSYIIGDAAEISFRFRMGASDSATVTAKDRVYLVFTRRGSAYKDHLMADIYGNLYARINGSEKLIYTNGDGKTIGGNGEFMDIAFRWYDVTNTYSVFLNGTPLVQGIPLHQNYRSTSYTTHTFNDDFEVESRAVNGTDNRSIELIRVDDKDGSKFTFDVDDIKLSRIETAQRGAVYYENSFDGAYEGISLISTRSNVYLYKAGASTSNIYLSAADANGNKYLNVLSGQFISINDVDYQQFTQGNTVIEFSIKGNPTHSSGLKAIFRLEDAAGMNTRKFLYVDSNGVLYTENNTNARIDGYKLDNSEWLNIAVVVMKNTDDNGKFGSFSSSSKECSTVDNHKYFFNYYINGNYVGSGYDTFEEWNGTDSWRSTKTVTTSNFVYTITDYTIGGDITALDLNPATTTLKLVDSSTTANHQIWKSADGLTYYDITFDASGNQTAYSTMVLTSKIGSYDENLRIFTESNFNASLDNLRIYEGTAPDFTYESANSINGGDVLKVDFAKIAFPAAENLTVRTYSSGSDVLGTFMTSGFANDGSKITHKDANGKEITANTTKDSDYSTLTMKSNHWFDFFVPMPEKVNGVYDFEYSFETTIKNIGFNANNAPNRINLFSNRFETTELGYDSAYMMAVDNQFNVYAGGMKAQLYNEDGTEAKIDNSNWNTLRVDAHFYQDSSKTSVELSYYLNGELLYLEDGTPAFRIVNSNITSFALLQRFGTSNYRLRYIQPGGNISLDVKSFNISANVKPVYNTVAGEFANINDNVTVIELDVPQYNTAGINESYDVLALTKTSAGKVHQLSLLTVNPLTDNVCVSISGNDYELYNNIGEAYTTDDMPLSVAIVYDDVNGKARYYVNDTIAYINLGGKLTAAVDLGTDDYSFAMLGSVSTSGYLVFGGFGTGEGAVDTSIYNLETYNVNDSDTAKVLGFQENERTNGIRIIAGLDTLYYSNIGFEIEMFIDGVSQGKKDISRNTVFNNVTANDKELTAESLGYKYLAALVITDVPENITDNSYIEICSYTEIQGFRHTDEKLKIVITNNGYYFEEDGYIYQNNFNQTSSLPSAWKLEGNSGTASVTSKGELEFIQTANEKTYLYLNQYIGEEYVFQYDMTITAKTESDPYFSTLFGYNNDGNYGCVTVRAVEYNPQGNIQRYSGEWESPDEGVITLNDLGGLLEIGKQYTISVVAKKTATGTNIAFFIDGSLVKQCTFSDYGNTGFVGFCSKGVSMLIDNVIVRNADSIEIGDTTIEKFEIIEKTNTSTRIRVATFNPGDFSTASGTLKYETYYGNGTEKTKEEYRAVFKKVGADIWGLQEDSKYFSGASEESPYTAVYSVTGLTNYKNHFTAAYNSQTFLTNFDITTSVVNFNKIYTTYSPDALVGYSHPWFLTAKVIVDGKEIHMATLHIEWSCKEKRHQQIKDVLAWAADKEYCIILGDFNPQNYINNTKAPADDKDYVNGSNNTNMYQIDWKFFTDAGFEAANGGRFGVFGTLMKEGSPRNPCPWDNIFVSSNIEIVNAEAVYESWMNDHAIFVADLELH